MKYKQPFKFIPPGGLVYSSYEINKYALQICVTKSGGYDFLFFLSFLDWANIYVTSRGVGKRKQASSTRHKPGTLY
jgi:hypothetical protein